MAEGIEGWPCNSRVSGFIPDAGKLKKLFIWMIIHGLTQNLKLYSEQLEQTSVCPNLVRTYVCKAQNTISNRVTWHWPKKNLGNFEYMFA